MQQSTDQTITKIRTKIAKQRQQHQQQQQGNKQQQQSTPLMTTNRGNDEKKILKIQDFSVHQIKYTENLHKNVTVNSKFYGEVLIFNSNNLVFIYYLVLSDFYYF